MNDSQPPTTHPEGPITICPAPAPDLTLITSDGASFLVHKSILSIHSPIFSDMLAVGAASPSPSQIAEVSLTEDARTLEGLLRYCYPMKDSTPALQDDLGRLWAIRRAANKYMMDSVEERVSAQLKGRHAEDALRIYALACRDGCEDEARNAAHALLRHSALPRSVPELAQVSGAAVFRLFEYREKCASAAAALEFAWLATAHADCVFLRAGGEHTGACAERGSGMLIAGGRVLVARAWWKDYVGAARKLLRERPCADAVRAPEGVWKALACAATCECCRRDAYTEFMAFVEAYAQEVDRATAKVCHDHWQMHFTEDRLQIVIHYSQMKGKSAIQSGRLPLEHWSLLLRPVADNNWIR
ncbi:hypothetical protein GLOTRDRAFT_120843 [Gloeophyllum trabeum ATCC 11539]|uniref:BTB domain-containing protein n=1 Tax=Gloeophyllum trabeum (strain ATCC 11539 / FP-39264 / Madison 617) TaxID=670483 RepID=S7RT38_GLOTA|nr:uncharacterized protein GLOTRDRAFT_120843 [Gloeophyllum trabeum ATCC 11539]EPQ56269.1 hypothetical protein GLOTRDRAFT_120843 [Gloeophyllum trabeum ATCC 11539]